MAYKLLTLNNPKILKGKDVDDTYISCVMHFRPINTKICPFQDIASCKTACLNTAGRGGIFKKGENTNRIQDARQRRTDMFLDDYDNFMELLHTEITKFINYCNKKDITPAFRLNGTSDIQWENKLYKAKSIIINRINYNDEKCAFLELQCSSDKLNKCIEIIEDELH